MRIKWKKIKLSLFTDTVWTEHTIMKIVSKSKYPNYKLIITLSFQKFFVSLVDIYSNHYDNYKIQREIV